MAGRRPSSYQTAMSDPPDPLADADERDPNPTRGRPKDAATLVLVRRDGAEGALEPRLLMGRRHADHAFMPAKWVFPGGRVDRVDFRARTASELRPEVATQLERGASSSRARALAVAAVRETYEEAGLVLGCCEGASLRPDLAALDYLARAITPPGRVRRFDARFFTADAAALASPDRAPGSGELEEIAWFTPAEARGLDLPSITRFVVDELAARLDDPARPVPFIRMVRGAKSVERS